MPKYEIVYREEIEADTKQDVIEWLFEHLNNCVKNDDVSCFILHKLKDMEDAKVSIY